MSQDEPEWVSLVLETYTKPNQRSKDSNNYGWVQKIAMRNMSRNSTATYLLYLLVQEFCGEYFCTTLNIIASLIILQ